MSVENQLYFSLGYCLFMLILALVIRRKPPGKINHFYGYRTPRSMKNQDVWDEANRYSSQVMYNLCVYSFVIPALGYFLFPSYNFLVTVVVNTLLIISVLYFTEKHLNNIFDKEGNRKDGTSTTNS